MISTSLKNAIREAVQKRLPRAVELRHRFHQIPEPSFEERATARLIAEELRQEGIELEEGLAQTGIVATVSGTRPGNVVALRADIDGLAIEENSSKPYASQNTGFAHSCGHDGHIVCVLEASRILWELRDHLAGSVKILFQPAEETGSGAQAMIEAGALGDPLPSAIFTVHTWPELDSGIVASKPGVITSGSDIFTITVVGKGGHGARPHETTSPILSAGRIVQSLSTLTQLEKANGNAFVVSVGIIRGGEQANTIPDEALIQGTIRTQTESVRQEVLEIVKAKVNTISQQDGVTTEVIIQQYCPHVHNNHNLYELFEKTADELLGPHNRRVFTGQSMGSEDFGFYTQNIPGLLIRLGMGKECQPLHTSGFDFSDASLESGITILTGLALMATESTF
jgi:amidohydrolase